MSILTDEEVERSIKRITESHRGLMSALAEKSAMRAEIKRLRKALRAIASDTYQTDTRWARGLAKAALEDES